MHTGSRADTGLDHASHSAPRWTNLVGHRDEQCARGGAIPTVARAQSAWRDVLAGGALFVLVGAFFWRTLSGDVYQPADGGDLVSFLFPTYRFAAGELAAGRLPLWNPTLYGGAPFVGDIQAGFLYLPNLALFLVNPAFSYTSLQWLAILHLFWAGLGLYVLLRTLRFETVEQTESGVSPASERTSHGRPPCLGRWRLRCATRCSSTWAT